MYLPRRYEDRSNMVAIRDLEDGNEASLDLMVRLAKPRYIGRQRFIFTVSASDQGNTGPQVIIEWFVSGSRAKQIIEYYTGRFTRGTRFIAFGKWHRDKLGIYRLKINKPDEIEVISSDHDSEAEHDESADPSLAAITSAVAYLSIAR
jgi:RecG-like helicase